ncbi:unnamed protein product [Rotaria sp. Silwood2]|nr:unnamed protein product [Rotaria sp. Silwood2]CAF3033822.1 unnamed protein product [Rotaria sp. Silwood2]CAF4089365.1 unnamed protein product [Rotaria sp. Silwood2]CAF4101291.1 unnamed protein product [Rotaria sp. Silwood2]CAF4252798.1 unnamed protein product [Rotaria sp. Silwood2]
MKKISIIVVVCVVMLAIIIDNNWVQAADQDDFEEARSASNEFLRRKRGVFHPGLTACEEQKREAREDYEERCEPSIPWQRDRKSNRFCPDINEWHELDTYEIGNGGGFDLDTLSKLMPQNISMEKVIAGVIGGLITAGVGGKRNAVLANRFLKRTFFHPGTTKCEEQKREAREDYEERCEPSFPLYRNSGTHRFCPDINTWKEFDNYEIGNGYESRDSINYDHSNRNRYRDRNQHNNDNANYPRSTATVPTDNEFFDVESNN